MIINLAINFVLLVFGSLFVFLPEVDIASIPFVGSFVQSLLLSAVSIWNTFMDTFPYAETAWEVFLIVILPFELLLLITKFFLGHRAPYQHHA